MVLKLRIGIDIDDTLVNSADVVTGLHNELYGTSLGRGDWFSTTPLALENWQLSSGAEISSRVNDLILHESYAQRVAAIEGAKGVLERLVAGGSELFAITSRPDSMREQTAASLERCFPGLFSRDALFMINAFSADPAIARITKLGVAQDLKLTHFIDDLPIHANAVAEGGITSILFSDAYHWNADGASDKVIRLQSWKAIGEYLDGQSAN